MPQETSIRVKTDQYPLRVEQPGRSPPDCTIQPPFLHFIHKNLMEKLARYLAEIGELAGVFPSSMFCLGPEEWNTQRDRIGSLLKGQRGRFALVSWWHQYCVTAVLIPEDKKQGLMQPRFVVDCILLTAMRILSVCLMPSRCQAP